MREEPFKILVKGNTLYFLENDVLLLKTTNVKKEELKYLENKGKKHERKGEIEYILNDPLEYQRIMVYYGVLQSIRDKFWRAKARRIVEELPLFDIKFWVNKLWKAYTQEGLKGVSIVSKAFRRLYQVEADEDYRIKYY